jgi:hypothetical protein
MGKFHDFCWDVTHHDYPAQVAGAWGGGKEKFPRCPQIYIPDFVNSVPTSPDSGSLSPLRPAFFQRFDSLQNIRTCRLTSSGHQPVLTLFS